MKEKTARGGVWLVLGEAVTRLAGLVKVAILGRLLSPSDFGLLGIALLVSDWLNSFTQTGLSSALIQKRDDIDAYLNTAWSLQLLRGFAVAAVLFAVAPLGARFFGNPEVIPLIRTTGLLTLMWEFANPAVVCLRRDLDFRKDVTWRLSGVLPGLAVGVAFALVYRNVWALMASMLASRVAEVVASYWIHPYRPRLAFEPHRARELTHFGKWVSWLNVGGFLQYQMDSLATGKVLGVTELGYYQVARQIANFPTAQVGSYAQGLLFPAFSKIDGMDRLRSVFLSTLSLLLLIVVPAGFCVALFAESLVRVILGAPWLVICPVLRILSFAGVAAAVGGIAVPLFLSSGRPQSAVATQTIKVAVLAGLLYPMMMAFGLTGVALSLCIAALVSVSLQLILAFRLVKATVAQIIESCRYAAMGSTPVFVAWLVSLNRPVPILCVALALASAVYFAILANALRFQFGDNSHRLERDRKAESVLLVE